MVFFTWVLFSYFLVFLDFNVISYLFFRQIFFVRFLFLFCFLALLSFLLWFKLFRFNLEVNYFLRNLIKFFSSAFFRGLFTFLPFVFCLFFGFLVGDFLGFLFLRRIFFVLVQFFPVITSFLLYVFYSLVFSFLSFLVFFMLPFSIIF